MLAVLSLLLGAAGAASAYVGLMDQSFTEFVHSPSVWLTALPLVGAVWCLRFRGEVRRARRARAERQAQEDAVRRMAYRQGLRAQRDREWEMDR